MSTTPSKTMGTRSVSSPQILQSKRQATDALVMERIRGFKPKRAGRSFDGENSGDSANPPSHHGIGVTLLGAIKGRDQYTATAGQGIMLKKKDLMERNLELQAKLDDTEAFWKDDARHKDKRISELERSLKAVSDSKDHLDIKLKMTEQELADVKEEKEQLRREVEQLKRAQRVQQQVSSKTGNRFL